MHCASVEERPFRAASEAPIQRGFSPRVLLTGPAAPRQPTRLFYSVILSEAKDPSARARPFRLSQGILSALLFMTMLFSLHRGNH